MSKLKITVLIFGENMLFSGEMNTDSDIYHLWQQPFS